MMEPRGSISINLGFTVFDAHGASGLAYPPLLLGLDSAHH
jgi:hypothetical protein